MALDPCPYCNRDFDHNNAGARANHVESCREQAEKYQQTTQPPQNAQGTDGAASGPGVTVEETQPPQAPQQPPQQAQPPAQADPQAQAQPPAVQGNEAIQQGLQLGQTAQALTEGSKYEKIQAGGAALVSLAQAWEQKDERERSRAKQTHPDDIRRNDAYPPCPSCDRALTNIPDQDGPVEFRCQNCGEPLVAE